MKPLGKRRIADFDKLINHSINKHINNINWNWLLSLVSRRNHVGFLEIERIVIRCIYVYCVDM